MLLEYIWGAVGFGMGVCFATICLTFATIMDDRADMKRRMKREQLPRLEPQRRSRR